MFLELLRESVIMRAFLAIALLALAAYLQITTGGIPDWLQVSVGGAMGFFFGSRPDSAIRRAVEAVRASNGTE